MNFRALASPFPHRVAAGTETALGLWVVPTLLLCASAPAANAQDGAVSEASQSEAPTSGRDITRPLQRIDLRTEVVDGKELTFTLRHDRPVPLDDGWRVNLRVDLPLKFVDKGPDENDGGFGDMLLQAIFVRHVGERQGFGFGTQIILPTATSEALGRGQWRLRPTVGYRWSLPEISEKTFFQFSARYDFSIAGDESHADTRELQLSPNLEIGLPGEAYFSIFPSNDIRYDFEHDEFFLPLNLEVGKEFGRIVTSLEGGVGLVSGDHAPYDWKVEARVGFRF